MSTQVERARLLDALLEEMGEKGYEGAEVDAALERAGLDSNGFLVEFIDKGTSLRAAYEQLTGRLRDKATWPARLWRAIGRNRFAMGCERCWTSWPPTRAWPGSWSAHSPQPGPGARPVPVFRRRPGPASKWRSGVLGGGEELPAEVEMLAIGAAESIVYEEIEGGRIAELPALGPAILFSVLVPFLGPEAASAEMATAREAMEKGDLEVA